MIKHIDSSIPKERYQADTVLLSNYVASDGYKYLFTMVDHFTKYDWIEKLKEKPAIIILRAFKRWIRAHYIPTILQTDNGTEFKKTMNQFYQENNIQQVYGVPYNPQHQGAVEAFNRTVQDFLTLARNHQGDSYSLEDSISDFSLYYNNRKHSTTKVAPYKAMMNIRDKASMNEIKCNTIQRRSKTKMSSETFKKTVMLYESFKLYQNFRWRVHSFSSTIRN